MFIYLKRKSKYDCNINNHIHWTYNLPKTVKFVRSTKHLHKDLFINNILKLSAIIHDTFMGTTQPQTLVAESPNETLMIIN